MSAAQGFVVPAGGGKRFESPTPGRSFALKLLGRETNESIMMFEETLPPGTASLFHLHHDSDEVAWVLEGEFAREHPCNLVAVMVKMEGACGAGRQGLLEHHDALIGLAAEQLHGKGTAGSRRIKMLPATRGDDKAFCCAHVGVLPWQNEGKSRRLDPPELPGMVKRGAPKAAETELTSQPGQLPRSGCCLHRVRPSRRAEAVQRSSYPDAGSSTIMRSDGGIAVIPTPR